MTIRQYLKAARQGLSANKGRSALTILGIVIGIAAIMTMMSVGQGAENLILGEVGGLGGEMIVIRPGREPTGPTDLQETLFADSLTERDVELLKRPENVPELADIMPAVVVTGGVAFEGETYRQAEIFGGDVAFFADVFDLYAERGRLFSDTDIRGRASVAVIGVDVKEELFGNREAVGERITIQDRKFRVIGVFAERGQASFINFDKIVVVPYTTAQDYLLGIDYYHEIITRAKSTDAVDRTVHDIEATLRESHDITDPEKDDFYVVTQEGLVGQIETIIGTLTIFLSSVVAIALVVGGIGIMNIMLVSVAERTREIGLRKALGATNKNILLQFLVEAVLLTGIGGILGIIFGALFSLGITVGLNIFTDISWPFAFPVSAIVLGLGVSASVGLVFGIYPARQASKKSPVEALRYE